MTLIHTCCLTASDIKTIVHIDKLSMTPPQQAETQILVSTLSTHVIVCLLTITQQSRSDTSADESILKTKKTTIAFSASQKVVLNKKRNISIKEEQSKLLKHAQIANLTTFLTQLTGDGVTGTPSHTYCIALSLCDTLQTDGLLNAIYLHWRQVATGLWLQLQGESLE